MSRVISMTAKREKLKCHMEMAELANSAALFLRAFFVGQYVTKNQTRVAMNLLLASTKRNIESFPNTTKQGKVAFKKMLNYECLIDKYDEL